MSDEKNTVDPNEDDEQAIEAEAQAQAICMQGQDFHRAYHAFVAKEKPHFSESPTSSRSRPSGS